MIGGGRDENENRMMREMGNVRRCVSANGNLRRRASASFFFFFESALYIPQQLPITNSARRGWPKLLYSKHERNQVQVSSGVPLEAGAKRRGGLAFALEAR